MWGIEHSLMLFIAGLMVLFLALKSNWVSVGAILLSQIPFWIGFLFYLFSGEKSPVLINISSGLLISSLFVTMATRSKSDSGRDIMFIALALVCLIAVSLDVIMLLMPFPLYMLANEALHYLQLIIIGGGMYVTNYLLRTLNYLGNLFGFSKNNKVVR